MYPYSILIVEDDSALCSLLNIKLIESGFKTLYCYTGSEAIELIRKNKDLFVLMDYQLPDMLSTNIIYTLKNEGIIFPFVLMTGFGDEKLAIDVMKMGAIDYMIKDVGFANNITLVINRAMNHLEIKNMLSDSQKEIDKREKKYRRIFENIHDVYFELNVYGEITEISPSVESVLFYKRKDILGTNIFEKTMHYTELNKIKKILKKKEGITDYELKIIDFNNKEKYISVTAKMTKENDDQYVVGIFRDITTRKILEYKLINDVVEVEELEKNRFAEDIHDGLGPLLSGIKLYINMLQSEKLNVEKKEEYIKIVSELIDEAVKTTRNISRELMPSILKDFGLVKAIESFCKYIELSNKFRISFDHNLNEISYDKNISIIIYRSVVELINNTLKHADASLAIISINDSDNEIHIKYSDDGIGFNVKDVFDNPDIMGLGIKSISNRIKAIGGNFTIKSRKGKGIFAYIYIDKNKFLFLHKNTSDDKN